MSLSFNLIICLILIYDSQYSLRSKCDINLIAPSNDEPCDATFLSLGTHNATTFNATITNNPIAESPCISTSPKDVWFRTTIPSSGVLSVTTAINHETLLPGITGPANTNGARIALYSTGSCSHLLDPKLCSNGSEIAVRGGRGQEVFIRIWIPSFGEGGPFQITLNSFRKTNVTIKPFPLPIDLTPSNNEPCTADEIQTNLSCRETFANTIDATTTINPVPGSLCRSKAFKDLWYKVTIPNTGVATISGKARSISNEVRFAIYTGNCSSLPNSHYCLTNQIAVSGDEGTVLYVRAWLFNKITGNNTDGIFTFCAVNSNTTGQPANPLPGATVSINDEPCNATILVAQRNCSFTNGQMQNATLTGIPEPIPACGSKPARDLWYRVTLPQGGVITLTTSSAISSSGDLTYSIYTGECNSLLFSGVCSSNKNLTVRGTPQKTIYIRVWKNNPVPPQNFSICVLDGNATGIVPIPIPNL